MYTFVANKNVHGVHDFVSFGDQSANAEKVMTPHIGDYKANIWSADKLLAHG